MRQRNLIITTIDNGSESEFSSCIRYKGTLDYYEQRAVGKERTLWYERHEWKILAVRRVMYVIFATVVVYVGPSHAYIFVFILENEPSRVGIRQTRGVGRSIIFLESRQRRKKIWDVGVEKSESKSSHRGFVCVGRSEGSWRGFPKSYIRIFYFFVFKKRKRITVQALDPTSQMS